MQSRSRDTETRLLAATLQLLGEGGLEACQIPAIAARAGVAVGTIYRRFRDKEALLDRVFLWAGEMGAASSGEIEARLAQTGGLSPAIRILVEAFTQGYVANATFYQAFARYAERRDDPAFHEALQRTRAGMLERTVEGLISAGAAEGLALDHRDVGFALTALTATLNATVIKRGGPRPDWRDEEERVSSLCRLVERYLRP
jgi:AcrR family transcriptional regulator